MGNCFKQQIEITKEVNDKSIQCNMEFTIVTEKSIEEIERNIDEILQEQYDDSINNFIEELLK